MYEAASLRLDYSGICKHVLRFGEECAPRGQKTKELREVVIRFEDPADSLPTVEGRKPNLAIGAAEALQLVGGFSDPRLMVRITKNFAQFLNRDYFHGAYGPRIWAQLPYAIHRLREDPDTRQAIVQIWEPSQDLMLEGRKDLPCTIQFQFFIRDHKLETSVTMRSNDVWWGLAYDITQFASLHLTVARVLPCEPGPLYHHARSLHIYERDWAKVEELGSPLEAPRLTGFGGPTKPRVNQYDILAVQKRILDTYTKKFDYRYLTIGEQWYFDTIRPYLSGEKYFNNRPSHYRSLFFAHNGPGPYECFFGCGVPVLFEEVHVHHVDDNHDNNEILNLKPAHISCHTSYSARVFWEKRRENGTNTPTATLQEAK